MNRRQTVFIVACAVLVALGSIRAADDHGVTLQTNVPVKMRDGVTLSAVLGDRLELLYPFDAGHSVG